VSLIPLKNFFCWPFHLSAGIFARPPPEAHGGVRRVALRQRRQGRAAPASIITLVQHWDICNQLSVLSNEKKPVFGESIRR
jgi:hypothetical protein